MPMTPTGISQIMERRADAAVYFILAGWALLILFLKFRLAHAGLATDDLYNYANALYNTNFRDKWLYVARYEVGRGLPSLVFDHWQPTTLVLWPIVRLFGPHSLLVVQALAPVWANLFLLKTGRQVGLGGFDRLFVVVICLFSPYMMLATMDSIEGFHATSLLLIFGAPLAWAAISRRWILALVLLVFFLNVRENAALYIIGAGLGYWMFRNTYFDGHRRVVAALVLAAMVFFIGIKGAPLLAGVQNFHFGKVGHALGSSPIFHFDLSGIDKDWAAYLIGLWPAVLAPGALMTILPEAVVLIVADKTIVNWYGMSLVYAGALAATFGLVRLRAWLPNRAANLTLSSALVLHMGLLAGTSVHNVVGKNAFIIEQAGFEIPASSLAAARAAIDPACRVSVFFQAMKGFGDLPYLQYPHPTQAKWSRFIVVSKRPELYLLHNRLQRRYVETIKDELTLHLEDGYLSVYEHRSTPCVKPPESDGRS
ncbi:MAG: hypothetical protein CMM61_08560 [Rhodospirillaceae bacterium]|nr:hypothetical protein [Rhodospirillaceae bacterium]